MNLFQNTESKGLVAHVPCVENVVPLFFCCASGHKVPFGYTILEGGRGERGNSRWTVKAKEYGFDGFLIGWLFASTHFFSL